MISGHGSQLFYDKKALKKWERKRSFTFSILLEIFDFFKTSLAQHLHFFSFFIFFTLPSSSLEFLVYLYTGVFISSGCIWIQITSKWISTILNTIYRTMILQTNQMLVGYRFRCIIFLPTCIVESDILDINDTYWIISRDKTPYIEINIVKRTKIRRNACRNPLFRLE